MINTSSLIHPAFSDHPRCKDVARPRGSVVLVAEAGAVAQAPRPMVVVVVSAIMTIAIKPAVTAVTIVTVAVAAPAPDILLHRGRQRLVGSQPVPPLDGRWQSRIGPQPQA